MTNMLQSDLDISLLNLDIKEEPIDIYPEETTEFFRTYLDIKEEIKEEKDTYLNNNVTNCDENYASIGQPNIIDLDNVNHHALLFIKEETNEVFTSETDNDYKLVNDISPKAALTQPIASISTESEISNKITHTSDVNKHISESYDEESTAKVEDDTIPLMDSENLCTAKNDDKKKMSRYQYLELKRLKIDMVVGTSRRCKSINLNEKNPSLSSAANRTNSGRNYSKHQAKSILDVCSISLNKPSSSRRAHIKSSKLKLEPVLTDANTPDESLLQDNTYSCSKCSFTSDKRRVINNHRYYHHNVTNSPIYNCAFCSQKYTRRRFILHMKNVHPRQKYEIFNEVVVYKCAECDFSADSKLLLCQHVKSHKSSLTIKGACCEHKSTTKDSGMHINNCKIKNATLKFSEIEFEEEIDNKHNTHDNCEKDTFGKIELSNLQENALTTVKCTKCSFSTELPKELKSHMESHNNVKVEEEHMFKCKHCSFEIDLLSEFLAHQLIHQPNYEKKTKNRPNVNLSKLDVHMKENKYTKCNICDSESTPRKVMLRKRKHSKMLTTPIETTIKVPDELNVEQKYLIDHDYSRVPIDWVEDDEDPGTLTTPKSHLQIQTSRQARRECTLCSFTCVTSNELAGHMVTHKLGQPIKMDFDTMLNQLSSRHRLTTSTTVVQEELHKTDDRIEYKYKSCPSTPGRQEVGETVDFIRKKRLQILNHDRYKCDKCSFITRLEHCLSRHQLAHQDKQPVKTCTYCSFKSTPRSLKEHMRRIHKENGQAEFLIEGLEPTDAEKAAPRVLSINTFQFDEAHNVTDIENSLNNVPNEKQKVIFNCSICQYSSTLRIKMNSHIKKKHSNSAPAAFQRDASLEKQNASSKKINIAELSDTGNEEIKCELCSGTFAKCRLDMHMVNHKTQKNMKCIECDFVSIPRLVMNHMKVRHQLGSPAFKLCLPAENESLPSNQKDSRSTLALEPAYIFRCRLCAFSTNLRIKLNCHVKEAHSTVKMSTTFKCPFCSWWTSEDAILKRHVYYHFCSSQPIFACQYCNFRGTKAKVIQFHNHCTMPPECHTLPPLKVKLNCTHCSFSTYLAADIKRHQQTTNCQNLIKK